MIRSEELISIEVIPFKNDIDRIRKTRELKNCKVTREHNYLLVERVEVC